MYKILQLNQRNFAILRTNFQNFVKKFAKKFLKISENAARLRPLLPLARLRVARGPHLLEVGERLRDDLSLSYRHCSYRRAGISSTGVPLRNFPAPVHQKFQLQDRVGLLAATCTNSGNHLGFPAIPAECHENFAKQSRSVIVAVFKTPEKATENTPSLLQNGAKHF